MSDDLTLRRILQLEQDLADLRLAALGPHSPTNVLLTAIRVEGEERRAAFAQVNQRLDGIEQAIRALAHVLPGKS